MSFKCFLPKINLLFGKGALENLGEEFVKIGKKALIVFGKSSMKKLGFLDKTINHLQNAGIRVSEYGGVESNPTNDVVDEGATLALGKNCDIIIGLGGGSAIDAAKAIAIVSGHSRKRFHPIWDFAKPAPDAERITSKTLPVIAITSTSGSGSHVTKFCVVSNQRIKAKRGISSEFIFPQLSIVDLDIVSMMPPDLTVRTGVDVLATAIESLVSRYSNPLSELYASKAIELVFRNLPQAYQTSEKKYREGMALADTYAGLASIISSVILSHAMSHPVSAHFPNIHHGAAVAALFLPVMRFNIKRADQGSLKKYCLVAEKMDKRISLQFTKRDAMGGVEAIEELLDEIKFRVRLRDLGVEASKFEIMAEDVMRYSSVAWNANPIKSTKEDIVKLYQEVY